MIMFDIKALESEVAEELAAERATAAKGKLKAAAARIAAAEQVVKNLRFEYQVLVSDLASEA